MRRHPTMLDAPPSNHALRRHQVVLDKDGPTMLDASPSSGAG
jgi:hypothetical protein